MRARAPCEKSRRSAGVVKLAADAKAFHSRTHDRHVGSVTMSASRSLGWPAGRRRMWALAYAARLPVIVKQLACVFQLSRAYQPALPKLRARRDRDEYELPWPAAARRTRSTR